jgi:hypothetical protein
MCMYRFFLERNTSIITSKICYNILICVYNCIYKIKCTKKNTWGFGEKYNLFFGRNYSWMCSVKTLLNYYLLHISLIHF